MTAHDGYTIGDYAISHGFTPGTPANDYATEYTTILNSCLTSEKSNLSTFVYKVGIVSVPRAGMGPMGLPCISSVMRRNAIQGVSAMTIERSNQVKEIVAERMRVSQFGQEKDLEQRSAIAQMLVEESGLGEENDYGDRDIATDGLLLTAKNLSETTQNGYNRSTEISLQTQDQNNKSVMKTQERALDYDRTLHPLEWATTNTAADVVAKKKILVEELKLEYLGIDGVDTKGIASGPYVLPPRDRKEIFGGSTNQFPKWWPGDDGATLAITP